MSRCCRDDVHSPHLPVDVFRAKSNPVLRTNGEHGLQDCSANVPDIPNVYLFFDTTGHTTSQQRKRLLNEAREDLPILKRIMHGLSSYAADDVNTAPPCGCVRSCLRWRLRQKPAFQLITTKTINTPLASRPCPAVRVKETTLRGTYTVEARNGLSGEWYVSRRVVDIDVHPAYPPLVDVSVRKLTRPCGQMATVGCIANMLVVQIVRWFVNTLHATTNSQRERRTTNNRTYPFSNASCVESYAASGINMARRMIVCRELPSVCSKYLLPMQREGMLTLV